MTTIQIKGVFQTRIYEIPDSTNTKHLEACVSVAQSLSDAFEDLPATSAEFLSLVEPVKDKKAVSKNEGITA